MIAEYKKEKTIFKVDSQQFFFKIGNLYLFKFSFGTQKSYNLSLVH